MHTFCAEYIHACVDTHVCTRIFTRIYLHLVTIFFKIFQFFAQVETHFENERRRA